MRERYYYWDEVGEDFDWIEIEVQEVMRQHPKVFVNPKERICTCGARAVGSPGHSHWCDFDKAGAS